MKLVVKEAGVLYGLWRWAKIVKRSGNLAVISGKQPDARKHMV